MRLDARVALGSIERRVDFDSAGPNTSYYWKHPEYSLSNLLVSKLHLSVLTNPYQFGPLFL